MKRLCSLLLALTLALTLVSCGEAPAPAGKEDDENARAPLETDTLRLEFVAGERDTDALFSLKRDLPPLLIAALAAQGVSVSRVEVTFGPSADATAQALREGGIDLAFLPSDAYLAHEEDFTLLALEAVTVTFAACFTPEELASLDGCSGDEVFYPEAVTLAAGVPDALADALRAALVALCTDASGNAALRAYGCASYLTTPSPDTLLEPYRICRASLQLSEK